MTEYIVVSSDAHNRKEILMLNASAELPTIYPAGSTAYTADLSTMKLFNGTEWVQIGGAT